MADLNPYLMPSDQWNAGPIPPVPLPQSMPSGPSPGWLPQLQQRAPWMQKVFGGVNRLTDAIGGAGQNPYLTPAENAYANSQRRASVIASLLANSGPAPVGARGPLQPFGEAMGAGQQAGQTATNNVIQSKLLQAQLAQKQFHNVPAGTTVIGPDGKPIYTSPQAVTGINSRFGNPMMTQLGRAVIFDRQTGAGVYADTQAPWDGAKDPLNKVQTVTNPDGSISVVNLGSVMGQPSGAGGTAPNSPSGAAPPAVQPLVGRDEALRGIADKTAAEARARELATKQVDAQIDLPRAIDNGNQAVQAIDSLIRHPGLPYITGWYSKAPIVPNTEQAGAEALAKQIEGKTFLEAYNTLKGGGQITEVEGSKASAAIARLYRAQSTEDYKTALGDLRDVIAAGVKRAQTKAGATSPESAPKKRVKVDDQGNVIGN